MGARNHSIDVIMDVAKAYGVEDRIELKKGGRHWKVLFDGAFIMILPQGNPNNTGRSMLNNIAQLRRAIEGRPKKDGR